MAITTAKTVADFIIHFYHLHGDCITNLKLQKLLYFAQGWYIALYDELLFEDEIQAWVHGPVVYTVYNEFKSFGSNPITYEPLEISLPLKVKKHLIEVIKAYGDFSAYQLSLITHQEPPWRNARNGYAIDEPSTSTISTIDMKSYFKKLDSES
ncbi:MAG: DUF4065 domain-containing protein [Candidatus Lokiarchaeota archaeon]|nr:DUF4065 domain-containing protein [Candidatus Lokiarchaeota archaeon]